MKYDVPQTKHLMWLVLFNIQINEINSLPLNGKSTNFCRQYYISYYKWFLERSNSINLKRYTINTILVIRKQLIFKYR